MKKLHSGLHPSNCIFLEVGSQASIISRLTQMTNVVAWVENHCCRRPEVWNLRYHKRKLVIFP